MPAGFGGALIEVLMDVLKEMLKEVLKEVRRWKLHSDDAQWITASR
jgi:hypothetical protein